MFDSVPERDLRTFPFLIFVQSNTTIYTLPCSIQIVLKQLFEGFLPLKNILCFGRQKAYSNFSKEEGLQKLFQALSFEVVTRTFKYI